MQERNLLTLRRELCDEAELGPAEVEAMCERPLLTRACLHSLDVIRACILESFGAAPLSPTNVNATQALPGRAHPSEPRPALPARASSCGPCPAGDADRGAQRR